MNHSATPSQASAIPWVRRRTLQSIAAALTAAASPAFAQIARVNTVMTNIQTTLVGVSVIAFTIALIWAGFKMAFQHAKWSEISNIVIGGIIVGGAAGIAAWLLT
jgi:type IV secretion system protein VirB2